MRNVCVCCDSEGSGSPGLSPSAVSAGWTFAVNEALLLFSSPPSLLSRALSLALCPFWRWNQTIVMLSSTAALCQSDGAGLELGLWTEWLTDCSRAASCAAATCLQSLSSSDTFFLFVVPVVEDDEDDFPNTRTEGEFLHNNNGSKEKRECSRWKPAFKHLFL